MSDFIKFIFEYISDLGYLGIVIGLMTDLIPSELILGYSGYLIGIGKIDFWGAVIAGIIGGTLGQLFFYFVGYFGGRPFLVKYGKYIFIEEKHIEMFEKWFEKYGFGVIFVARFIPLIGHTVAIPAGIAKMSLRKYVFFTILPIIPWTILFLTIGIKLGENWTNIRRITERYMLPVIGLIIISFIIYLVWKRKQDPPIVIVKSKK